MGGMNIVGSVDAGTATKGRVAFDEALPLPTLLSGEPDAGSSLALDAERKPLV